MRKGVTLLEVLVVLAVLAIVIGLLLPAVQTVRTTAARMEVANSLRQISLGLHHCEQVDGRLPHYGGPARRTSTGNGITTIEGIEPSPFRAVLPYLDVGYNPALPLPAVRLYLSKTDPSLSGQSFSTDPLDTEGGGQSKYISFGANIWAFQNHPTLSAGYPDGTSHTIRIAERYALCADSYLHYADTEQSNMM